MNYVLRQGRKIEVDTVATGVSSRRRQKDPFVKVPLRVMAAITKATRTPKAMVGILLLHEAWKAKGASFTLSNVKLARYGISREVKRRALAEFEASGLILVKRRNSQTPVVTVL